MPAPSSISRAALAAAFFCASCQPLGPSPQTPVQNNGVDAQTDASKGPELSPSAAKRLARGGRLFDDWAKELDAGFEPDSPSTATLDGKGGPFGNGTLPDQHGKPMPNTGHDYRLVTLLGPDLRGASRVHACKAHHGTHLLLVPSLLDDQDDRARWTRRLHDGEDGLPAFGAVLDSDALDALVSFLFAVRDGTLPGPAQLFPEPQQPCEPPHVAGGDAAAGRELFAARCAKCHGEDGRSLAVFGDAHSLGSMGREHPARVWLALLNGKPRSGMGPMLLRERTYGDKLAAMRNIFAALADKAHFPALDGSLARGATRVDGSRGPDTTPVVPGVAKAAAPEPQLTPTSP